MSGRMKKAMVFLAVFPILSGCGSQVPEMPVSGQDLIEQSHRLMTEQEFNEAMDVAFRALSQAEESEDQNLKAEALCAISLIDLMATRDAQSWENACEAETVSRSYHLSKPLCNALILKGRVCSYAGLSEETSRDDEALSYLLEAYTISSESNLIPEHVQSCFHLSEVYVNKNRWNVRLVPEYYRLAGSYLEEGERMASENALQDLSRRSISFRIRYLRQGGRTRDAVGYCERFLALTDSSDWLTKQQVYDQLTVLYSILGQTGQSVDNHRNYVYAMQQYMRQKSDSRLQELENQYAYLVKQREIERERRIIIILFALMGVLALLFLLVILYNRKINRQKKALEEADASKKNLLEAISSDLVDVTSLSGVNDMMELARKSYSMDEEEILKAVKEKVGESSTLNEDVSEYFYKLILHRKNSVKQSGLTERELEILRLSGQGLPAAKIADMLHISPRTVTNHKQNIYTKMGVKSTPEMIFKAKEAGLL